MLCGIGSRMIAAISPRCSDAARCTASRSLNGRISVASITSGRIPAESGSFPPTRSGAEITFSATESWPPWKQPWNFTSSLRPVTPRASLTA